MSLASTDGRSKAAADLHGLSGKTMSGGKAALRRRIRALVDEIEAEGRMHSAWMADRIRSVLACEETS